MTSPQDRSHAEIQTNRLTLAQLLRLRAQQSPERGYTFLDGEARPRGRTFAELDRGARRVAVRLRATGLPQPTEQPCVMLVFPAGLDFLTAFFGCMYAGAIGVPTRYPNPRRPQHHTATLAADSGARFGLTTIEMQPILTAALPSVTWLAMQEEDLPESAPEWQDPGCTAEDVAYLQYTSGSTSTPKGVVLQHRHVVANCYALQQQRRFDQESRVFTWLPHFHDMGLVLGLMEALYCGCECIMMAPGMFAQRPLSWLEGMSTYKATHTAAPNFAFEACTQIPDEQLKGLDLSSIVTAINGAEHVRPDTVERFLAKYVPYGFAPEAFCPGYGLAENTLAATTTALGHLPRILSADAEHLTTGLFVPTEADGGVRLTSSGVPVPGTEVRIADSFTQEELPEGQSGEICLKGPSVTAGYWKHPELLKRFEAHLQPSGDGPYLRTGDLGMMYNGELYVRGRIDDMFIVRGVNIHPEDVEPDIEIAHPSLARDGCCVFSLEIGGELRLALAVEVQRIAMRTLDPDAIAADVVSAVSEQHGLEVAAIVLLRPRHLPRTHSGKKQRQLCRRMFLDGALDSLHTWITPQWRSQWQSAQVVNVSNAEEERNMEDTAGTQKLQETLDWLRDYAAERINSRLMDERRSIPPYVVMDLANHGVLGMQAPVRYGGLALNHLSTGLVLQQLAAIDLTIASFTAVNNVLGVRPILRHATPKRQEELLPVLAQGRELIAFAMTEPGAGSNVRGISSRGVPAPGGWELYGTKIWSGTSSWAGYINTFVQLEPGDTNGPRGVTAFTVRQGSRGLRMGPEALTMGLRAMVQNEVHLEGVKVTADDMLGTPGNGMTVAMDAMEYGRYALCWASVGVLKRCLQLMLRHGKARHIATGRVIENPVTLTRISDLTAAVTAVESLAIVVAGLMDANEPVPPEFFCACKVAGPEFAWKAADGLVQQMAGRGYIESNIAPQILRDARILRIFEGPTEPMTAYIGSKLINDSAPLESFLRNVLHQQAIAAELQVTAARIADRTQSTRLPMGADRVAAQNWANSLAGEVGVQGLLLASIRYRAQKEPSAALSRAEEWTRLRLDQCIASALGVTPSEAVYLNAVQAEDVINEYVREIGDVEQTMASEDWNIDPLLRKPGTASAAVETSISSSAATPAKANNEEHSDTQRYVNWISDWVCKEFGRDRATISVKDRISQYGLDSVSALRFSNALEAWLGVGISTTAVWDYPTIGQLSEYVATLTPAKASNTQPSSSATSCSVAPIRDDLAALASISEMPEDEVDRLLAELTGGADNNN
jgi:acyl-CoA synthetase (AMP-forming)/AMP-acid ligase II/alkylation response protein AidB-like acyl-CoA dehydrogenase/acyl carrier protein